jgi:hypothetical protein
LIDIQNQGALPLDPAIFEKMYSGAVPYLFKRCAASGRGYGRFLSGCTKKNEKYISRGNAP